jgi:hypothetical protein
VTDGFWSTERNAVTEEVAGLSHDDLVQLAANSRRQLDDHPGDPRLLFLADECQRELDRRATGHVLFDHAVPTPFAG